MKIADIPTKFPIPFASSAGVGYITSIPELPSGMPGRASLTEGFPPYNFDPVASGGIPPWGADMNGLQNQITLWLQWATAGGYPVKYDATFQTDIGGYPQGAFLQSDTIGHYWISSVDDNLTNPNAAGAGWLEFPDILVQLQADNYDGSPGGVANLTLITLGRVPSSAAELEGVPIRYKAVGPNTVIDPKIRVNSMSPSWTVINSDGSALGIGQITTGMMVEGKFDGTNFQLTNPAPPAGSVGSKFVTGCIYMWPTETAPAGTLECAGQTLLIASYPGLYGVLGTIYGGDGISDFKLPDYRGEFIRGWDHGRGLDPNAATRTDRGDGTGGDRNGTNQLGAAGPIALSGASIAIINPFLWTDAFSPEPNKPLYQEQVGGAGLGDAVYTPKVTPSPETTRTEEIRGTTNIVGNSDATETRPVNIYTMYVIGL